VRRLGFAGVKTDASWEYGLPCPIALHYSTIMGMHPAVLLSKWSAALLKDARRPTI
jgi:hypothetical protein